MRLGILVLLGAALSAGAQTQPLYFAEHEFSSSTEKLCVQQPSTPTRTLIFKYATLKVSSGASELDFTLLRDVGASTTTALTPVTWVPGQNARTGLAFYSANGSGGTTGPKYTVASGASWVIGLDDTRIGAGSGLAFCISAASGSGRITIWWTEN